MEIPLSRLTAVTGVSGSGKSTLVQDVLVASLHSHRSVGCLSVDPPLGTRAPRALVVDQSPIGINPRSTPATYTGLSDYLRDIFARLTGLDPSRFSFNRSEGACPECHGLGAVEVKLRLLPSTWIVCESCDGDRYSDEVLSARAALGGKELSIADLYRLPLSEIRDLLAAEHPATVPDSSIASALRILDALCDTGLGYLSLGRSSPTLSGGEAQRIKLASRLGLSSLAGNLLVLDEPSTGLHPADLDGLLRVLDRLVAAGATIVVVEHNTDVIRAADWVVDLGPGSGPDGGALVYAGPVEGMVRCIASRTGRALRDDQSPKRPSSSRGAASHPKKAASNAPIAIRGARANNLRSIDVDFPKSRITVVTGLSGCGKSSLVAEVLEAEAGKRFLETLSLYERQGVKEGPEVAADTITGLGVTASIRADRSRMYNPRHDVGLATGMTHQLSVVLAFAGSRRCPSCRQALQRDGTRWLCRSCGPQGGLPEPRLRPARMPPPVMRATGWAPSPRPRPEKLIVHPDKPLCGGAMHSPGFFPQGYLCKPFNGGYDMVQALAGSTVSIRRPRLGTR